MKLARILPPLAALLIGGCGSGPDDPPAVGTLEWDRIEVAARVAEPVLAREAREGARVAAGQLLLRLDGQRLRARLAAAEAARAQELDFRLREVARLESLVARRLAAPDQIDQARTAATGARARRTPRIAELLDRYRLDAIATQRAGTLSGGQRQRLALAAATLHGPELLFLDEPTSAVDPQSRREFWETLFELCAAGTTILVSTHYMDEAERCHALAILDRGRVMADGTPKQLEEALDATVVEVETADPARSRPLIAALDGVLSVTQLGVRLRVLVDPHLPEPERRLRDALQSHGLTAATLRARPSLEDVFVAATQGRYRRGPG